MDSKHMSRRSFLRLAAVGAATVGLAACGATPTATPMPKATAVPATAVPPTVAPAVKTPVTIAWWTESTEEWDEKTQRAMVDAFHAAQKDVKVEMTVLPDSGYTEKMTTALGANSGAPDVGFFWNTNWVPSALALDSLIARDKFDINMYYKSFFDTHARYKNTIVGLPLGVGANFLMYNPKIFDEAKVPYPDISVSTDNVLDYAKKLTDTTKKRWGADRPRGPYRAIWFNMGAQPWSADGKKVDGYLNSPASLAAYQFLWDLVSTNGTPTQADLDVLSKEGTGPVDLFLGGRLATATLNQGHMLNAIKANAPFSIVREPGLPGKERWANQWSNLVGIWKGTKVPDAAWTFLKYYVGPEGQKYLMDNANLFPSIKSVMQQYKNASNTGVQAFMKILEDRNVREVTYAFPVGVSVPLKAQQDLWDSINLLKVKREDIKAALDAAVPVAQKYLDEAWAKV
jgi:multiple sugar transport system substrate-binding protein